MHGAERKLDKDVRQALANAGAVLVRSHRHLVYRLPNGRTVSVACTAGDWRTAKNTIRVIKREAACCPSSTATPFEK